MKFVKEIDLRDHFWKKYGYRKSIMAYQFENQSRHGGVDLLTIEKVQDFDKKGFHYEIVSFEFKLNDIEKAFSQANYNSEFCHKNFVVVPIEKKKVILERYSDYFKRYPNIGVICVAHPDDGGQWEMIQKPRAKRDEYLQQNQAVLKLCLKDF